VVTEVGRQPWLVYGVMLTHEGVTPHLDGRVVLASIAGYELAYSAILVAGIFFMVRLARVGPEAVGVERGPAERMPNRPMSGAGR
jgi:cytochrome d ubiquinol oxidase subunit I